MDIYHIALFVHILALVIAASATSVLKLAVGRRGRASTIGEMQDWHNVLTSVSKLFPICLLLFVLTGSYMLSRNNAQVWSTGFVVAGLVGVAWLLVSGVVLATKGKALKQMLDEMAKSGADRPAPKLVPPPIVGALPIINTFVALSVVFDMVTKPVSIPVALGALAIGLVIGAAVGIRRPAPAAEQAPAA